MSFWKLCKNGRLIKDNKNGTFVEKYNYDELLRENKNLKDNLTKENFNLKINQFIGEQGLSSEKELSVILYFNCGLGFLKALMESEKHLKDFKKEEN